MRTANTRAPAHKRRRNLRAAHLIVPAAITLTGAAMIGIPTAQAVEQGNIVVVAPAGAAVGANNVAISLQASNTSTAGEALTLTAIRVAPSCDAPGSAAAPCTPANANLNVLNLGVGTGGAACGGRTFTVGAPDASGVSTVTPNVGPPLVIAAGTTCTINFTATVLNVPTPAATNITAAAVWDGAGADIPIYDDAPITINQAGPGTITTTASVIGTNQVQDRAFVNGRQSAVAGGTLIFELHDDPACTAPAVYTSPAIPVPVNDTSVDSPVFSPANPGTYHWKVFYSGDANNAGFASACGGAGEVVTTTTAGTGQPVNGGGGGGGGGSGGGAAGTCNGLVTTISGGSGNENLVGTLGNDVVNLGSGNDTFVGNGGNDVVCGGSGNDVITTGDGNDTIFAGSGDDTVNAGAGNNTVDMGSGEL